MVEITFIPTEHGGKKKNVYSGYRPQFYYDNKDRDANQTYIDFSEVKPGDTAKAYLTFLSPKEHKNKLKTGSHFLLREGQKIVVYGHVIDIIDLNKQ